MPSYHSGLLRNVNTVSWRWRLSGGLYGIYWILRYASTVSNLTADPIPKLFGTLTTLSLFGLCLNMAFLITQITSDSFIMGTNNAYIASLIGCAIGTYVFGTFAAVSATKLLFRKYLHEPPRTLQVVLRTLYGFSSAIYLQSAINKLME